MVHVEITKEDMKRVAGGGDECLRNWVDHYKAENEKQATTIRKLRGALSFYASGRHLHVGVVDSRITALEALGETKEWDDD